MHLYEKYLSVMKNTPYYDDETNNDELDIVSANDISMGIPQFLQNPSDIQWSVFYCTEVYYISDIHLISKVGKKWKRSFQKKEIRNYIKEIAQGLYPKELSESLKEYKPPVIIFGGDVSFCFELSKIFYTEFIKEWKKLTKSPQNFCKMPIYAVLGNHELGGFEDNMDACYTAYRELFQSLGINFLENSILEIEKALVVGGTGIGEKWFETYNRALKLAKEKNRTLIVITHFPISDWKKDRKPDDNCVYFNGHTHKNSLYHDEERNIHIYANNQIGYRNSMAQLRKAYVYRRANPFASYIDGYHVVSSEDYLRFYDYMDENISGIKLIEHKIEQNHAKFYMIKRKGYYGFFLIDLKTLYICNGGKLTTLGRARNMEELDRDFLKIINRYLEILSPYRNAQERISEMIKSFNGDGSIHGCIIDIDFFNHVMLNPFDGKVTYYHSPKFGYVESYENMLALLEAHNRELATQYKKKMNLLDNVMTVQVKSDLVKIDIRNSIYHVSYKMNKFQRLFNKKILRDWDDNLLLYSK